MKNDPDRPRLWRDTAKAHISAQPGTRVGAARTFRGREFKVSPAPGGQQVESAVVEPATSHSPGTREDPARSGRAAPDTQSAGPGGCAPGSDRPHTAPLPAGGPALGIPVSREPPRAPRVPQAPSGSRAPPGPSAPPRPTRTHPAIGAPAAAASAPGAPCSAGGSDSPPPPPSPPPLLLLLLQLRLLQSRLLRRAARLLRSPRRPSEPSAGADVRTWLVAALRLLLSRPPPAAGPRSRPRRSQGAAARTASRKQKGRALASARPRLPPGATPATNTNFPKPLPAPGNGGGAGATRLKGRRRPSPPSLPLGPPPLEKLSSDL